ncbi:MAG: hypothetical protein ACLQVD_03440 [Capsulimonadaceae bacterium]
MKLANRLTRAGVTLLAFGVIASFLPDNGIVGAGACNSVTDSWTSTGKSTAYGAGGLVVGGAAGALLGGGGGLAGAAGGGAGGGFGAGSRRRHHPEETPMPSQPTLYQNPDNAGYSNQFKDGAF